MRLDASYLHFISQQQLRVLTSIQLGMRNHQWVPSQVVARIARLRGGQAFKVLRKLLKNKFVVHTGKNYDGYKLAYLGYDYLALQTFIKRGILKDVISKIGVGKQSDIYKCITPEGEYVVLKLTRLGRSSFRSVKKNRQYIQHRKNYNWLYLSRLSSIREFLFMQLLYQNGFQTPTPIDTNRHAIVMSLVAGQPLCHIQRIQSQQQIKIIFEKAREMLVRFAQNGLIHSDYNEFNLITNYQGTKLTVIDFPQCISINHPNAQTYFNRDVQCIYTYFDKMVQRTQSVNSTIEQTKQQGDMQLVKNKFVLNVEDYPMPVLADIIPIRRLDREIKTKGYITLTEEKQLDEVLGDKLQNRDHQGQHQEEQGDQASQSQEGQQDNSQQDKSQQQYENQNSSQEQIQRTIESGFQGKQLKKMSFDITAQQLQMIVSKPAQIQNGQQKQLYDKQLQFLMSQLNHHNLKQNDLAQQNDQKSEQQQQERAQFKGLTAFQIRLKLKQQKKQRRQQNKKVMTEDQFIKNAVKKSHNRKVNPAIKVGNKGNKRKDQSNKQAIKQGFQGGW